MLPERLLVYTHILCSTHGESASALMVWNLHRMTVLSLPPLPQAHVHTTEMCPTVFLMLQGCSCFVVIPVTIVITFPFLDWYFCVLVDLWHAWKNMPIETFLKPKFKNFDMFVFGVAFLTNFYQDQNDIPHTCENYSTPFRFLQVSSLAFAIFQDV